MGTSDIALERVQALLKVDTGDGSVYEHLVRIARAMATSKPDDALGRLESLSRSLKKGAYRGVAAPDQDEEVVADAAAEEKRQQWCEYAVNVARPPSDPTAAPKVLCAVHNFMEDAAMFEWAGVGFGKQETFHIAMSLRKLAADNESLDKLRLWGKILGISSDYYVAEGVLKATPGGAAKPALPGSPEDDVEPQGEGANTWCYWVSAGGAAPWIRLPSARASHIVAARKVKRLMTGSLGAPVDSTPWFPGKERHLLRSQIARISATCTLAVDGFFEPDDAEEAKKNAIRMSDPEGFTFPGHDALATLDSWKHAAPALLGTGKCTWPDLEAFEEGTLSEEQTAALTAAQEAEPAKEMLSGLGEDLADLLPEGAEGSPAWNIKVYGDKGTYTFEGGDAKSYRITAVRSMIWPGAISVAQGTKFANLYIGDGTKSAALVEPNKESGLPLANCAAFSSGNVKLPMAPEDVMDEPGDLQEQEEPQPPLPDEVSDGEDHDEAEAQ
eukprot:CAMPEP_0198516006 /NCGR_PEP_ID=MMETSP1462-20131121/17653_1 /TAXON_ID=1333877 /ORGANISM="Brandtodinium nutriculum, Strain RCC3387" /LENGTH=498 /DNA_ID=CAMNT_0044245519 /DNA_START=78 /DNA_END=1574 /DNA_ORIENTATION=-